MGSAAFDQFSILHVASGIIAYFWGVPFSTFFVLHLLFEVVENTRWGMHVINKHVTLWPGGKPYADALVNSVSDQCFASLGWIVSHYLDKYYKRL